MRTTVRVQNQTRTAAAFDASLHDVDHGGDRDRVLEFLAVGEARRGAGAWVTLDERTFELAGGRERSVELTIAIPRDAGAGGHYAGVVFTARPTSGGDMFDLQLRKEIPILITVRGTARRELRVEVTPEQRWRWRGGQATWIVELHNAGDLHEVVEAGSLRVDGLLGGASRHALRPAILLPGERRTQRVTSELRDAPDAWSARAELERADADVVRADAARTWVLPWWLLVLLAVAVALVAWRLRARASSRHQHDDDEGEEWPPGPPDPLSDAR